MEHPYQILSLNHHYFNYLLILLLKIISISYKIFNVIIELQGEGFERLANEGVKVKAGYPIIKINRDLITLKGFSLITPVLITNIDIVKEINYKTGFNAEAREDVIIEYKTK